jgi:hypothetical protein
VKFALERNTFGAHGYQKDAISKMVIYSLSKGAAPTAQPSSRPNSRGNLTRQPSFHDGLYGASTSRSRGMSAFFEEEIRTITKTGSLLL